jgi:hypothetical protein
VLHLKNTIKQSKAKIFKTKKFSKIADKACIFEADLCKAISQVMVGQVVDLGGGVYKKRLNSNAHRSIILSKGAKFWIFQHLFAKNETGNLEDDELVTLRVLAKAYENLSPEQLYLLISSKDLQEICYENQEIQK